MGEVLIPKKVNSSVPRRAPAVPALCKYRNGLTRSLGDFALSVKITKWLWEQGVVGVVFTMFLGCHSFLTLKVNCDSKGGSVFRLATEGASF